MKHIFICVALLLFFTGCAPKLAKLDNTVYLSYPYPKEKFLYNTPTTYYIKYPIYNNKTTTNIIIDILDGEKVLFKKHNTITVENIAKKENGFIQKHTEAITNNNVIYANYKLDPDFRRIYDFEIGGNIKLTQKEKDEVKQEIIQNENLLINLVKTGISRGKIIYKEKTDTNGIKLNITKRIDNFYLYHGKKALATFDSMKSDKIKCGGYSLFDYNTLKPLKSEMICYGKILYKNKKYDLKVTLNSLLQN